VNRYLILVALAGCSSLVDDPCTSGFHMYGGVCTPDLRLHGAEIPDAQMMMPDATVIVPPDGLPITPPPVCLLPTTRCGDACVLTDSDPENCGHCGRECASGICSTGVCVGDVVGHIVVIGHDYAASDPAMDLVIGNAVRIGAPAPSPSNPVRIGWLPATLDGGVAAAARGLAQVGDSAINSQLATIDHNSIDELDAVVIEPLVGDGAAAEQAGVNAASALDAFLVAGHSVVVLETTGGVGYRFLHGAGLATLAPPVDISSMVVTVSAPADAVASGLVSTYLAKPGSVGYPASAHAVVVDSAGDAVVIHATY
jgi:hypothetical protein